MKRKFFDTQFAIQAGLDGHMPRVLKYVVENQNYVLSSDELTELIRPIRTILKTPMATMVDRMIEATGLVNFAAYYVPVKDASMPEILTANNITLDLKQVPNASALSSMPKLRNKVLLNLNGLVSQTAGSGANVSDADRLRALLVRGQLVASYWDHDNWPSPSIAEYAIKSYSIILSALISRYYNLSLPEQNKIGAILGFYQAQWYVGNGVLNNPVYLRLNYLGNRAELEEVAKLCIESYPEGMTLDDACALVAQVGPDKMKQFNRTTLMAIGGNLGDDLIVSQLGLEYPPYWVYMLICSLSGAKTPMVYQLNSQRLIQEGRSAWLNRLMADPSITQYMRTD